MLGPQPHETLFTFTLPRDGVGPGVVDDRHIDELLKHHREMLLAHLGPGIVRFDESTTSEDKLRQQRTWWFTWSPGGQENIARAMRAWAEANPWCDTQGITYDEWEGMAQAVVDALTERKWQAS